jgi:hypothetical protein
VHTTGNISLTVLAVMQSIAGGVVFLVTAVVVAGVLLALRRHPGGPATDVAVG